MGDNKKEDNSFKKLENYEAPDSLKSKSAGNHKHMNSSHWTSINKPQRPQTFSKLSKVIYS